MSSRPAIRRCARGLALLSSVALLAGVVTATQAAAVAPTFQAAGSARQVYVTGVAPSAQMSLVTAAGVTLKTQSADSLGGLLFRDVPPATGYRVRRDSDGLTSAAVTVHSEDAAPWDPGIYNQ